eukprot:3240647-Amphidinium_carterae.1
MCDYDHGKPFRLDLCAEGNFFPSCNCRSHLGKFLEFAGRMSGMWFPRPHPPTKFDVKTTTRLIFDLTMSHEFDCTRGKCKLLRPLTQSKSACAAQYKHVPHQGGKVDYNACRRTSNMIEVTSARCAVKIEKTEEIACRTKPPPT